ncbi:MAG: hypothetical protein IT384_00895 [Deltaproteobacteria bacterium]|nr:hypothetical protein [Deltaproteobacteria bacterium]
MRATLTLLVLASAGCGDPLVGSSYLGTAEIEVRGVVLQGSPRIPAEHGELKLSVFWIGAQGSAGPIEQEARLESGLAEYSMKLFDAPSAEAGGFSDLLPGSTLAIGVIALYADKDEDGKLDVEKDLLLGAGAQHLLVFAGSAVDGAAPAGALLGSLAPGYHVVMQAMPGNCRFVEAEGCAAEGTLVEADDPLHVSLTLWAHPEDVVVPAPALVRGEVSGSIWTR